VRACTRLLTTHTHTPLSSTCVIVRCMRAAKRSKRIQGTLQHSLVGDVIGLVQQYAQQVYVLCVDPTGVQVYDPAADSTEHVTCMQVLEPHDNVPDGQRSPFYAPTAAVWRGSVYLPNGLAYNIKTGHCFPWLGLHSPGGLFYNNHSQLWGKGVQFVTMVKGPSPGLYAIAHATSRTVARLDDGEQTWRALPSFVHSRCQRPGVLAHGTSIYIIGGRCTSIEQFDTSQPALEWRAVTDVLSPLCSTRHCAVVDDVLYVPQNHRLSYTHMSCLAASTAWRDTTEQWPCSYSSQVVAIDGRVVVLTPNATVFEYDPKSMCWRRLNFVLSGTWNASQLAVVV
jgi:hypothetical protein